MTFLWGEMEKTKFILLFLLSEEGGKEKGREKGREGGG